MILGTTPLAKIPLASFATAGAVFATGSFTVTGNASTLTFKMPASTGAAGVTTNPAAFALSIPATTLAVTVTPIAAVFRALFPVTRDGYTVTGIDARFNSTASSADTGHYVVSVADTGSTFSLNAQGAVVTVTVNDAHYTRDHVNWAYSTPSTSVWTLQTNMSIPPPEAA